MNDLVSRLRAMADELLPFPNWPAKNASVICREAAALERKIKEHGETWANGQVSVNYWQKRAEKAEAEAAALREIAQDLCDFNAKWLADMRTKETWVTDGVELEESPFIRRFREALSQPAPGAALLKREQEAETRAVVVQQLKRLVETWCLTEGTIHAIEVVLADLDGKE